MNRREARTILLISALRWRDSLRSAHSASPVRRALIFLLSLAAPMIADEPKSEAIAAAETRPWVGVSSCSAQPCHGDVSRDNVWPIWGNEVTLWIERDPHAQAYRVLSSELSKRMAERLRLRGPANRSERCLSCHSPGDAGESRPSDTVLADGVGCEACHGRAQQWLSRHTLDGWRKETAVAKRELGMLDTKDLHSRAKVCAVCHVGAATKNGASGGDVSHDLIAAGHPALKFEFTAYLAKMPKHWSEKSPGAGFDARAWAVGQATSAAAALDLLAERAAGAGAGNKTPWPEFAEYDCYSCHHQLYGASKRPSPLGGSQQATDNKTDERPPLGLPSWGTWYLPMMSVLPQADADPTNAVAEIERLMRHPGVDRKRLAQAASQTAHRLDAWGQHLATAEYPPLVIDQLLERMKAAAPLWTGATWDSEAQLYLALVALHYAKHDSQQGPPRDDPLTRSLRQTREELMFPTSVDGGVSRRFDSPRNLDPARALRERLLPEIERLLNE